MIKQNIVAPKQQKGAKSDITYCVNAIDEKEGYEQYLRSRKNLLDINNWQQYAGKLSAAFYLTDPSGTHVQRLPLQGDYIKINLPSSADDKFEWVRIEAIEEQTSQTTFNSIAIRVRPSDPPKAQEETEHFFSKEATSSFSIQRTGRKVEAAVRGRNELPNLDAPGLLNKIRNIFISIGAMAGLNYPQWKGLVKGILTK